MYHSGEQSCDPGEASLDCPSLLALCEVVTHFFFFLFKAFSPKCRKDFLLLAFNICTGQVHTFLRYPTPIVDLLHKIIAC